MDGDGGNNDDYDLQREDKLFPWVTDDGVAKIIIICLQTEPHSKFLPPATFLQRWSEFDTKHDCTSLLIL